MRNRDDDSGYGRFRHLQLLESEVTERGSDQRMPALRKRMSRTPPKAVTRIQFETEIRITPSLDGGHVNRIPTAAQTDIPAIGAERALFDRLAGICERIANGHYNRPEVLEAVARRIVASGEIGSPGVDR